MVCVCVCGGSVNLPNRTQNGPKMSYSLLARVVSFTRKVNINE